MFLAVVMIEGVGVAGLRPAGERLRPFVDLLAAQGLLVATIGALLVVDRPFAAARAIRRRAMGERGTGRMSGGDAGMEVDTEPEVPDRGRRRRAGSLTLLWGAIFFGLAALLWAVGGGSGN